MKTISAKLYPNASQERTLYRFLRVGRWVYNQALEQRIKAYNRRSESITYNDQQALLTGWRDRMEWLRLVPAQIERDALRRVDRGMKAFFRRVKAKETPGFPRFKSCDRWRSFEVLQPGKYLRDGSKVHVPGVGPMRYRGMQPFEGAIKGVRVIRKPSGWYVQLIVDTGPPPDERDIQTAIGIDVGLTHFCTLSDGTKVENPRWYRASQHRLRFLQRRVSRRLKGSNRRRRAVQQVQLHHERVGNKRRDWTHKLSRHLINEFDMIAVENLNVKGLARTRLAKSIYDAAWTQFFGQIRSKAENAGCLFVEVDPRNTSQECSACGRVVPKTLSDRVHRCGCGYVADRDENAAKNVLARAIPQVLRESTRGECTSAGGASASRRGTLNREHALEESSV